MHPTRVGHHDLPEHRAVLLAVVALDVTLGRVPVDGHEVALELLGALLAFPAPSVARGSTRLVVVPGGGHGPGHVPVPQIVSLGLLGELGARGGDLKRLRLVRLRPLELFTQVTEVRLDAHIVRSLDKLTVVKVSRGGIHPEHESSGAEGRQRSHPTRAAHAADVQQVLVRGFIVVRHPSANDGVGKNRRTRRASG